jgi:hypothetical protein
MAGLYPFGTGNKINSETKSRIVRPYWVDKNDEMLEALPNAYQPVPVHVLGAGPMKENLIKI